MVFIVQDEATGRGHLGEDICDEPIENHLAIFRRYFGVCDHLGWSHTPNGFGWVSSGSIWDVESSASIWDHMCPSRLTWDRLGSSWVIWDQKSTQWIPEVPLWCLSDIHKKKTEALEGSILMKWHHSAAVCEISLKMCILRHVLKVGSTKYCKLQYKTALSAPSTVHAKRCKSIRNRRSAEGGGDVY